MIDCEPADVYVETKVKARKPHRCCECRGRIKKSETYQRINMVYGGSASTWKTCNDCAHLRCQV